MFDFSKDDQTELPLDDEWIELILIAKQIGLNPDEIREFLNQPNPNIAAS